VTLDDAELLGECRAPIPRPSGPGRAPYDLVLLDRDGTLNVHRPGYVSDPADLLLLPGAAQAVAELNGAGCAVVLVTNQRGMATGDLTRQQLLDVHRSLIAQLADAGARLDAIQVCPHERSTCDCRKPRAGLVREALRRSPWATPERCVLLGDQGSDLAAATTAGVTGVRAGGAGPSLQVVVEKLIRDYATRV
jgi:histidinol-phosphate phosphatase family domain/HAD-superfamily hydrolase, subfamily IIIA